MGLGKLEEVFDFMSSQVNRRQEGVMTHGAPPSLVGKRSHRTSLSLFTTHQPRSPIPVSTARHSHIPFLRAWNEFAPVCTQYRAYRAEQARKRREQGCNEVRLATLKLHVEGTNPSANQVASKLSNPGVMRTREGLAAWHTARRELGLES
jgi:hypothetical protein